MSQQLVTLLIIDAHVPSDGNKVERSLFVFRFSFPLTLLYLQ